METQKLVKMAIRGDESAFCKLIEDKKENLYKIAFSYVKKEEDALDIVGETVYKAYISINKVKNPEYFNTWITKILINSAINFLNKSKKVLILKENSLIEELAENFQEVTSPGQEVILDLYAAIEKLDQKHRTIIMLRYLQDLTIAEIADVLDWPEGTVKTYLYRGLKYLRLELEVGKNE